MKATYTPGPWNVRRDRDGEGWNVYGQRGCVALARAGSLCDPDATKPNARLIAAAPDMLAALEALAAWDAQDKGADGGDDVDYAGLDAAIVKCRAALAKARNQGPSADQE